MIKVGSDFSGVGAFNQALIRLGIKYEEVFACDMDKYARQTFILNYGEPKYYPENVYEREIPTESLDIFMTSPPCQSFSLAGKRKGEDSKNGVLFYNSHEFITVNKPRYFIFENVKGLLSDDGGKTFQRWIDYLGGKTVNGNPVIFPHEKSVPYHVYYQVMNAKHYGVPQNRERIFIIGIRDDADNDFSFPKPFPLEKRLKDVLESEVDEKYFLSDKMLNYFDSRASNFNNGNINFKDEESVASTITSSSKSLDISDNIIRLANVNPSGNGMNGNVYGDEGVSPTLSTNKGEGIKIGAIRGRNPTDVVKVAKVGRSDEGKRLRKESLNRGKDYTPFQAKEITFEESDIMNCVTTATTKDNLIQTLEINENGTSNALTTVQKDNVVVIPAPIVEYQLTGGKRDKTHEQSGRVYDKNGIAPTIHTMGGGNQEPKVFADEIIVLNDATHSQQRIYSQEGISPSILSGSNGGGQNPCKHLTTTQRIRRLTPAECFRLMDFNPEFIWDVSDSQAYRQAGNSIVVNVLALIISKLNL